jgi:hypothetical protein
LGFFSSGWIEQSRPTRRVEGPIFRNWKKRLDQGFFGGFLKVAGILGASCSVGFESSPESSAAMKLPRIPGTFKDPANPSIFFQAAEEIAQNPSKLPAKKSSGKIALTIEHFHDSSKQKRAIKNFRFVVNFSSSEFEIGCQVLFLTPGITHKIRDKNSLFSSSSVPRNKNEISWEFLSNFFDNF